MVLLILEAEEKFYTEASGPSNELVYNSPKGLKDVPLYVLNDFACQRRPFLGSCFTRREKSTCDPQLGNNFRDVSIFQSILIQLFFSWS